MDLSLQRRQLLMASVALGAAGGGLPAQAASPSGTPQHPDLAVKLIIVGRRRPGTTLAEHRHHIRKVHGELVLRNIAADPANAPRRYVQNAVFDGSFRTGGPAGDAFALNRDFVTQIWMPDLQTLGRARQSPFYLQHVKHDEDNFVDQANVVFMPVRERVMAGAPVTAHQRVKLFGFVQRAPGTAVEDFRRAWSAATWRTGESLLRHVQNDTLPTPAGPAPLDGIDECWLADDASAYDFLGRWNAWVNDTLVRSGLAAPGHHFALLAREDVIHAGPQ
ncbi:EthD domain-containing protein [Ideonella livida]|uniref:EthD domain-containing protein n=1 Tax=Ideonella livida TaxID=2707176 RepID=A0A7C9PJY2_9BURK|nr:EthD domain-containing protein [Ideonella livida]NDY93788.1 EthD domain-containing protein [Ideonella livida]